MKGLACLIWSFLPKAGLLLYWYKINNNGPRVMDESSRKSPPFLFPNLVGTSSQPHLLLHRVNHPLRLPHPPPHQNCLQLEISWNIRSQRDHLDHRGHHLHRTHLSLSQLLDWEASQESVNSKETTLSEQDSQDQMAEPHQCLTHLWYHLPWSRRFWTT